MSVYKPAKSRFYQYDFMFKKKRYTGSTGVETPRKAEEVERRIRNEVALGLHDTGAAMTLDEACGRWWDEVGQHLATGKVKPSARRATNPPRTKADRVEAMLDVVVGLMDAPKATKTKPRISDVERRLEILLRLLGPNTRLVDLTTRKVSAAIEKRRRETYQKAPDKPGKPAKRYQVSNATVNADIIISLRRIMSRAEKVWEVKPMPAIDWKSLALKEPTPEIRLYTAKQRAAWLDACDLACKFPLRLLFRYGFRLNELFFPPEAYLPADEETGPRLAINKRKRGVLLVPLREDDAAEIATRVSRAQALKLKSIWYELEPQAARGARKPKKPGEAITYYGLQSRLNNAADRAGIDMTRLIHGTRHHAGTVILAKTKNLRLAQQLLGHADIKSTLRYAHALESDLRAALEDDSPSPAAGRDDATEQRRRWR